MMWWRWCDKSGTNTVLIIYKIQRILARYHYHPVLLPLPFFSGRPTSIHLQSNDLPSYRQTTVTVTTSTVIFTSSTVSVPLLNYPDPFGISHQIFHFYISVFNFYWYIVIVFAFCQSIIYIVNFSIIN